MQDNLLTSVSLIILYRWELTGSLYSDDDVEDTQLSNSFHNTCHAWEVRQGYTRNRQSYPSSFYFRSDLGYRIRSVRIPR